MKNLIALTLIATLFSSCDPSAQIEANIENLTDKNLSILFISSDSSLISSKTLQIAPSETVLFQEDFVFKSTYLEPNLEYFDSVLIKNQADVILRVYKPNDSGKNIYNIDDYWISSEPSKRSFKYEYKIENEDFE